MRIVALFALALLTAGCTSTQNLGMMTRQVGSPGAMLSNPTPYTELGSAEGRACRYFVLAVVPFGDSTPTAAMEKALEQSGGDALLNVSATTGLYGFFPIYNVFSFTCTTVRGIAIQFDR
jgi:hypothetical protein